MAEVTSGNVHEGHKLVYVYDHCIMQQACEITLEGNVLVTGDLEVVDIDGDARVYCDTCDVPVYAGDAGLAVDWQVA
jgi:hypothetical protein